MPLLLSLLPRRLAPLTLTIVFCTPASALDTGCVKAISAANLKMIDAPAFHTIKQFGTMRFELLKAEGKLFKRMGAEPWGPAGMSLQELKDAVRQAESLVQRCERGGRDAVDGIAAEVIRFTVKDPTAGILRAQVWIGIQDGLPHREESSTTQATTTYANIKPPR